MDPLVNQQISHYFIQERLQSGGMANVYKAFDHQRGHLVALKVLQEDFTNQPRIVLRFKREAKIAQKLNHPNIVPFYDYGEVDGTLYMVMKLMEEGSLLDRFHRTANVTLGRTARWLRQIASALDFAHSEGVIHRDLKPGNILLENDDNAYLADFGIARITEATRVTTTGQMMPGTALYMSPEQASGSPQIDHRTDIYSFGVIAYLLATGRHPFAGNSFAVLNQHLHHMPPLPSRVNDDLPLELDGVLLKCLGKNPNRRYRSASEFAAAFEQAIAGYEELMVIIDPRSTTQVGGGTPLVDKSPVSSGVSQATRIFRGRPINSNPLLWMVMIIVVVLGGDDCGDEQPGRQSGEGSGSGRIARHRLWCCSAECDGNGQRRETQAADVT
jgi:serine/threonine-protein kinase